MGAEHSHTQSVGPEIVPGTTVPRRIVKRNIRQNSQASSSCSTQGAENSPSRAPSPPLSVCSDLPYVSYTVQPIGDSPKIKNKSITRSVSGKKSTGAKPKRPQTQSSHIVIVKPGVRDNDDEEEPELAALRNIPQFLPILRESISSATYTKDPELSDKMQSEHMLNICSRLQTHLNMCATQTAAEQNHLIERTKIVSNSITTLYASFVDMQKTFTNYAEHFGKIRSITQQLVLCNSLLTQNMDSIEAINNFLDEDRLEPFVWLGDDKSRKQAEDASEQDP